MTAVSFSTNRGTGTTNLQTAVTVGTQAPSSTFDIELRWNQTANSTGTNLTRKDLVLALTLFRRFIMAGGGNVGSASQAGGTTGVIGPP